MASDGAPVQEGALPWSPTLGRRHKVVRDLEWVMGSEHLLSEDSGFGGGNELDVLPREVAQWLLTQATPWLDDVEQDPSHLIQWLKDQRNASKLGFYFGALLEYWATFCPVLRTEDILNKQQVIYSRTHNVVGQLKCIFRCTPTAPVGAALPAALNPRGKSELWHWESSIKFFVEASSHPACAARADLQPTTFVVGPYLHENLAHRLEECRRKLALTRSPSLRAWIYQRFRADTTTCPLRPMCILRGYVFRPLVAVSTSTDELVNACPLKKVGTDEAQQLLGVEVGSVGGGGAGAGAGGDGGGGERPDVEARCRSATPTALGAQRVLNPTHNSGWWVESLEALLAVKKRPGVRPLGSRRVPGRPTTVGGAPTEAAAQRRAPGSLLSGRRLGAGAGAGGADEEQRWVLLSKKCHWLSPVVAAPPPAPAALPPRGRRAPASMTVGASDGECHWLGPVVAMPAPAQPVHDCSLQVEGVGALGIPPLPVLRTAQLAAALAADGTLERHMPVLLAELAPVAGTAAWLERSRGFVMPTQWDPTPILRPLSSEETVREDAHNVLVPLLESVADGAAAAAALRGGAGAAPVAVNLQGARWAELQSLLTGLPMPALPEVCGVLTRTLMALIAAHHGAAPRDLQADVMHVMDSQEMRAAARNHHGLADEAPEAQGVCAPLTVLGECLKYLLEVGIKEQRPTAHCLVDASLRMLQPAATATPPPTQGGAARHCGAALAAVLEAQVNALPMVARLCPRLLVKLLRLLPAHRAALRRPILAAVDRLTLTAAPPPVDGPACVEGAVVVSAVVELYGCLLDAGEGNGEGEELLSPLFAAALSWRAPAAMEALLKLACRPASLLPKECSRAMADQFVTYLEEHSGPKAAGRAQRKLPLQLRLSGDVAVAMLRVNTAGEALVPAVLPAEVAVSLVDTPAALVEAAAQLGLLFQSLEGAEGTGEGGEGHELWVGLDMEWQPYTKRAPVQLVQLATLQHVWLFDMPVLMEAAGCAQSLEDLFVSVLTHPAVAVVGYGLKPDLARLAASYPRYKGFGVVRCAVELDNLAKGALPEPPAGGLAGLVAATLRTCLNKEQQTSAWERRPLSEAQMAYAALDAHTVLQVAANLIGQEEAGLRRHGVAVEISCRDTQDVQAAIAPLSVATIFKCTNRANLAAGHTILKTIGLYILPTKRLLVAVLHLHHTIDLARTGRLLQLPPNHRLRLAQHSELLEDFGFPAGSMGPFGLRCPGKTAVVVDEEVATTGGLVLVGAGAPDAHVALPPAELLHALQPCVGCIHAEVKESLE